MSASVSILVMHQRTKSPYYVRLGGTEIFLFAVFKSETLQDGKTVTSLLDIFVYSQA